VNKLSNSDLGSYFYDVLPQLVAFLERNLPMLSDDWWKNTVVDTLSFHQRERVERNQLSSLSDLDLAALLRVFDSNWFDLAERMQLSREDRHYVKEMQTIRNRWAHRTEAGYSKDDVYRDLDTLQRFARLIGCDEAFLGSVGRAKQNVIELSDPRKPDAPPAAAPSKGYQPGEIVMIPAEPGLRGAVVAVIAGDPEDRYMVFVEGETRTYYHSQLRADQETQSTLPVVSAEAFHTHLTALQITYPGLSTLYSLNAARIDFIPYQFRPVIRFIHADRPRLLIADGVGVGKTIEAGLILQELKARRDIESVLVICPRPLVTEKKWVNELKRFGERFTQLDGATLRYCITETDLEGQWPAEHRRTIMPYSLLDEVLLHGKQKKKRGSKQPGLLDLDPAPKFDLVIVDEAHHVRNPGTLRHEAVRFLSDHAEAVLFLTATPLQMGSHDLYVLLNLLRPDLVIDQESFKLMAEPNPHINRAVSAIRSKTDSWIDEAQTALEDALNTAWGMAILSSHPGITRSKERLAVGSVSDDERVRMINDLEEAHSFARVINRTRRRDIGAFTVRKPQTVSAPFTADQQVIHDDILEMQAEILSQVHDDTILGFLLSTIRRQAASCLPGLVPHLEEILTRHVVDAGFFDESDADLPEDILVSDDILDRIQDLLQRAVAMDPADPKFDRLKAILEDKGTQENQRAMVFSTFRHTLSYLHERLLESGFRVGVVHGGVADEDRISLRERFAMDPSDSDAIDVLLFSEVGSEGLDYQFCDCLINYDLPWNPMKIEQRIGRIDRNGQQSETVAIYNFVTPGTVEADIYERCLMRIGVFNNALGASEEILGKIVEEIRTVAENLTLTPEERAAKLQQIADNEIRLVQEEEELEARQMELFGISVPEKLLDQEIADASSYWLAPASIRRLVGTYVQERCGVDADPFLGEKAVKTLRLASECRETLLEDFRQIPHKQNEVFRDWEKWLKGNTPHLSVTFDSEGAVSDQRATFIMPLHPLVKQAAHAVSKRNRVAVVVQTASSQERPGRYDFIVYQWRYHGVRENVVMKPVSASAEFSSRLPELLMNAKEPTPSALESENVSLERWGPIDAVHYQLWSEELERHNKATAQIVEYRRQSLETSHKARMRLLQEQLTATSDPKIGRMKTSQIATAEADFARRIQGLDIALERTDITAEPVAYGILVVVEGK
jgi:ATP-dependent helicase HepA